jgi:hypothetical protein
MAHRIAPETSKEDDVKYTGLLFFLIGAVLLFGLPQVMAKSISPVSPLPMTSAASGEEMFAVYCSSCHGQNAKGGPAPDLATLAKRNNGQFPAVMVKETIPGEARVDPHGPKDMPAWGIAFRYVGSGSRLEIDVRVNYLTEYIRSLQEK